MGILMMLQSILGILAGKLVWSNPGVAKHLYQFFWPSMIVTFFINLTIFVTGGLYIVNIEDRIHLDWVHINETLNMEATTAAELITEAQFIEGAQGAFRLLVVIGIATTVYL